MSKKHFIALANILRIAKKSPILDAREIIGYAIANMCQADNPRFDMQRFLEAAQLPE